MDEDKNTISTDLLSVTRSNNQEALKRKNLGVVEKLIIQNQDVILMFIEKDHSKTVEMWTWYKAQIKQSQRWEPRVWQGVFVIVSWVIIYFLSSFIK